MKYLIFIFGSFLLSMLPNETHEFHMSKSMVEYKADKSEVQISINIFIDDLETALQSRGVEKLFIGTEKESEEADKYILEYLEQTFEVEINSTSEMPHQFIGKEISEDLTSIWCYFLIPMDYEIKKLRIRNSILLETFDDQKNITSIIGPQSKKSSFMSTKGDDEKTLSY